MAIAIEPSSSVRDGLNKYFKYDSFKSDLQEAAVEAVYKRRHDVFVSMPTGAGKSLCYQLPAVMGKGVTLVLSPLIALIEDQVTQLNSRGISTATLNSKTPAGERKKIYTDLRQKKPSLKMLYVTPEMAATPGFRDTMSTLHKYKKLNFFAIDEAHCLSEWGHDFRPDYLKLGQLRELYPDVPMVALTATATPTVQDDIIKGLKMKEPVAIFKASCFRNNLFYDIRYKETLKDPIKDLKDFIVKGLTSLETEGSGIIYCRTREGCQELAGRLSSSGIVAKAYHAGLKDDERSDVQSAWMSGLVPVIVATISFGMGVDKSNVRFVVHWTLPKGIEAYYQESGRAGRDGKQSFCRIYYSRCDKDTLNFLLQKEASKASAKSKKKDDPKVQKKESLLKSFECLVKYCEDIQCRHLSIAKYFEDPKPKCNECCDACKTPASVKEMLRAHKLCLPSSSNKKALKGSSMSLFEYGEADPSLYEGGKWGNRGYNSDDDGSSDDDDDVESSSKSSTSFIEAQLKKRRKKGVGSVNPELNELSDDSKLIDAQSTTKVPRLAVKVRDHCLEMLIKSLKRNSVSTTTEQVAIELEYRVFKSAKSAEVYKLQIRKKVSEIDSATREGRLHSSIKTEWDNLTEEGEGLVEATPPTSSLTCGFVMASELPRPKKQRLAHNTTSKPTVNNSSCNKHDTESFEGFKPASSVLVNSSTPSIYSVTDIVSDDSIIETPPTTDYNDTIITEEQDKIINTSSTSNSIDTSTLDLGTPPTTNSPSEHSNCCPPSPSRDPLPTEPLSSFDDTLVDLTKAVLLSRKRSRSPDGEDTHSPKKIASSDERHSKPTFSANLIAQKNAVVALDDQWLSASTAVVDKRKSKVASLVVKTLNPYYKSGKIVSKDLFKKFAKTLSDHICKRRIRDSKEEFSKSTISQFFSFVSKVRQESDFGHLHDIMKKKR